MGWFFVNVTATTGDYTGGIVGSVRFVEETGWWGEAVNALQLRDGILWTRVTRAMRQRWSVEDRETSGLSNFLSGVREARIVAVFTEVDNGDVDVSLRAQPGVDVAQVALRLGGGGHALASGLTMKGDLDEVEQRVLAELHRSLAEQETRHG